MTLAKPYSINLEIYHSEWKTSGFIFYQGDKDVYPVTITIMSKGRPLILDTAWNVMVTIIQENKVIERITAEIMANELDKVRYNMTETAISHIGEILTEVQIVTQSQVLTCQGFKAEVKESFFNIELSKEIEE